MSKAKLEARKSVAIPSAAATVQITSPSDTPTAAATPGRRAPRRAFFVTTAVSGPGMRIRRIEMARNGARSMCTARIYRARVRRREVSDVREADPGPHARDPTDRREHERRERESGVAPELRHKAAHGHAEHRAETDH